MEKPLFLFFSTFLMWVSDEKAHIAASCFDPDILSSV